MHTRAALVACALLIATSLPRAQTSTADGVDAFGRGNYPRAAEILTAMADQLPRPDHVAEFFLATMYENGLGVPTDTVRACALYLRASIDHDHSTPFGARAGTLLNALRRTLTKEAWDDCELLALSGFDHGFRAETFLLDAGYRIAWDLRGATITFEGNETRINMLLGLRGVVFLPLKYTQLASGPSRATRRHFIEIFKWMPDMDGKPGWSLQWTLYEVVRNTLVSVANEPLMTIAARTPPTGPAFAGLELVSLRVNDDGNPEWAVNGPRARGSVIEPEAERLAAREQAHARAAAESRVDWTLVRDRYRAPTLSYSDADGCGHVFVYGWSADRTEAISVRADKDLLQLSTTAVTFDASTPRSGFELVLHVYERPVRSWPFCTDVAMSLPEQTWSATRGTVTVELSPPGILVRTPFMYRATIHVTGAEFLSASGERMTQLRPITLTAIVGWLVG